MHCGLIHKLQAYGISGKILSIIKSFLSDHSIKVVLSGSFSKEARGPRFKSNWETSPAPHPLKYCDQPVSSVCEVVQTMFQGIGLVEGFIKAPLMLGENE